MTRVFAAAACFFAIAGTACAATPDPIAQQESRAAEIARVEAAAQGRCHRPDTIATHLGVRGMRQRSGPIPTGASR